MCMVSAVGDNFRNVKPYWNEHTDFTKLVQYATSKEVEELRNEIAELKKVLIAAKLYDKATGQPDCELDEKVALIKGIADALGIDMTEVFNN